MTPIVPPSSRRGVAVLQPTYFLSNVFYELFTSDVNALFESFLAAVLVDQRTPFATFKQIWLSFGWQWMHFRVVDSRSRLGLASTVLRTFTESAADASLNIIHRIASLYALYTFYNTQPVSEAPALARLSNIPIPHDLLDSLHNLPELLLKSPDLHTFIPTTKHILHTFQQNKIFYILPHSSLHSCDPARLPRFGLSSSNDNTEEPTQEKRGRPTKQDRLKKGREALSQLDNWLAVDRQSEAGIGPASIVQDDSLKHEAYETYRADKGRLLDIMGHASNRLYSANQDTYAQIRRVQQDAAKQGLEVGMADVEGAAGRATALQRVEKAASEWSLGKGGVLGLLDGTGWIAAEEGPNASLRQETQV